MNLLLDAHALLWYVDQDHLLSAAAHAAITDPANELLLSAGTVWEIAIKTGLAKLTLSLPYDQWMAQAIADLQLTILPITVKYASVQANLPFHHRDPFDRILVAQCQVEKISLISKDPIFDQYEIGRVW